MTKSEASTAFKQGYYLAVANLLRMHGEDSMAVELLREFGPASLAGIDEYDHEVLKPVIAELRRLNRFRARRPARPAAVR